MEIVAALLFVGGPALVLLLVRHVAAARALGPIVLCYAAGLLIGLSGLLPDSTGDIRTTITEASLALALPLLLFSVDIAAWRHVAGRAMLSMLLAVVAVVFVATLLFHLFQARGVAAPEQLAGMAVGMYTGGIANMGAIKLALGIPDARYLLFATVDTVIGSLYLLFVLTVAHRLFARFLRPFPRAPQGGETAAESRESQGDLLRLAAIPGIAAALGAALAINYRTQDFEAEVRAFTQGRGVDVVLDMVGGPYVARNLRSLALDGRYALISLQGGRDVQASFEPVLRNRLTITGSTLRPLPPARKAVLTTEVRRTVWPMIAAGAIRPRLSHRFPLEQAADAHRAMESPDHRGKIVLDVAADR